MSDQSHPGERTTYLLVDGENIDATLGTTILRRRPQPEDRPRWERPIAHLKERWGQDVVGLFFLAVNGEMPMSFVQALMATGYRPVPLSGPPDVKIVDVAIQQTLEALLDRDADVVLASHDGDFAPQMDALAEDDAGRRLGLLAFPELVSGALRRVPDLEIIDLEHEVGAFNQPLPRLRVVPIEEFDPLVYL
ncbi:nuclease [Marmoricola endophyticus]|uniref:Nuclease n=1 Tax=Marmoricola endophyticus TaxID=2040280 RepID=A0A917EZH6_9ACTN|nr:nuclease [Marmoricola endophyticus]GGF33746.1 nuclease [Marmoricola endophyticus]